MSGRILISRVVKYSNIGWHYYSCVKTRALHTHVTHGWRGGSHGGLTFIRRLGVQKQTFENWHYLALWQLWNLNWRMLVRSSRSRQTLFCSTNRRVSMVSLNTSHWNHVMFYPNMIHARVQQAALVQARASHWGDQVRGLLHSTSGCADYYVHGGTHLLDKPTAM